MSDTQITMSNIQAYRQLLPELKQHNKLVIVISHDHTFFDCADRVIELYDGRLRANNGY